MVHTDGEMNKEDKHLEIKKIGVIGAGQMGNGIAQVCAQSGFELIMVDIEQRFVDKGMATITKNMDWLVGKEKFSRSASATAISEEVPSR